MRIDDEISQGKTVNVIRWLIFALCVVCSVWLISSFVRFYHTTETIAERAVPEALQPTLWKGEYLLPLPPVTVNVRAEHDIGPVLHVSAALVLSHRSDVQEVYNALPLVKESILVLARGLSVQDVDSPEAIYRFKQALFRRLQWVLTPVVVQDVLISEWFFDRCREEN